MCAETTDKEAFFKQSVHPIFQQNCYECHSHSSGKARGGLVLDSRKAMIKGGDLGPAIIPEDPENSLLIQAISHSHKDLKMPKKGKKLDQDDIETLTKWIAEGAYWPGSFNHAPEVLTDAELAASHWAYQPVQAPTVPELTQKEWKSWARNPIDHFIAAKLEQTGVTPNPTAPADVLLRRLSYDLTGLAPEWKDRLPQNPELNQTDLIKQTTERLLNSPEYGRKWGRHWLDVVRYSDTAGDNSDFPIPEMALYRDYVVDSFNADIPFDQFIKEQLAGDLMDSSNDPELRRRRVIATSFVAGSMRFCDDLRNDMPLVIGDTIDAVGQAFMGMTLSCAKCHNHKYDPIPTSDYYSIYGFFSSTRYPYAGREGRQVPINLVPTGIDKKANERIHKINVEVYKDLKDGGRLSLKSDRGKKVIGLLKEQRKLSELAFGVRDAEKVGDSKIHLKGEPKRKGDVAPRGFFSAITPNATANIPEGQSGRLQLAEWIASNDHPLTARVIVNRIWNWHFGKGLVPTINNFGVSGQAPTHPELLNYLTQEFINSGWSVKSLHRLILDSATYRQAWRHESEGPTSDTANSLYWRFDRRRLNAEEIRDSALSVAGKLDLNNPGKHPFPDLGKMRYTQHKPYEATYEHDHRSLYLMTSRIRKQEFTTLFDAADPTQSTGSRRTSTVPLQALYLLNSPRFNKITKQFAQRLSKEFKSDAERITATYRLCYFRNPSEAEKQQLLAVLKNLRSAPNKTKDSQSPWEVIAHSMLLSNEFVFLD